MSSRDSRGSALGLAYTVEVSPALARLAGRTVDRDTGIGRIRQPLRLESLLLLPKSRYSNEAGDHR